jgi:hypothetical protein
MRLLVVLSVLALLLPACSRDPSPFGQEFSPGRASQGDPIIGKFAVEIEDAGFEYLPSTYDWEDLALGKWEDHEQRLLLDFDDLPGDATSAQEATLALTVTQDFFSEDLDLKVYEIARSWTDDEVSWLSAKAGSLWTSEGGDYGREVATGTISAGDSAVILQLNTMVVDDWIGEDGAFNGVSLVAENEGGGFALENMAEANKAILYISYFASGGGLEAYEGSHARAASIGQTSFEPSGSDSVLVIGNVNGFARRVYLALNVDSIPDDITVARAVLRFKIDTGSTNSGRIENLSLWRVCGDFEGEDTELCSGGADQTAFAAEQDSLNLEIGDFGDFLGQGEEATFIVGADVQEAAGGHITVFSSDADEHLRPMLYLTYTEPPGSPWP